MSNLKRTREESDTVDGDGSGELAALTVEDASQSDSQTEEREHGAKRRKTDDSGELLVKPALPTTSATKTGEDGLEDALDLDLEALLDFAQPSLKNLDAISARFDRIAELLMREYALTVEVYVGDTDDSPSGETSRDKAISKVKTAGNAKTKPTTSASKATFDHQSTIIKDPRDGRMSRITEFQIMEMEYYLLKAESHEDPFTHGSEEQKYAARWYFHRAPKFSADSHRSLTSTTAYRTASRKGLDLTIGRPTGKSKATDTPAAEDPSLLKGGILLRAIRNIKTNKIVAGPSLLVDEILSLSRVKALEVKELVDEQWKGDTSAFLPANGGGGGGEGMAVDGTPESPAVTTSPSRPSRLYFKRQPGGLPSFSTASKNATAKSMFFMSAQERQKALGDAQSAALAKATAASSQPQPKVAIYRSPRIGLELSHPGTKPDGSHPRVVYVQKPYRYFMHPDMLTTNGRAHTFLGVLHACVKEIFAEEIRELMKTKGDASAVPSTYTILSSVLSPSSGSTSTSSSPKKASSSKTISSGFAAPKIQKLKGQISRLTGIKEQTADKYYAQYIEGLLGEGELKYFVGAEAKGVSSSPGMYLKMMGTVERVLAG